MQRNASTRAQRAAQGTVYSYAPEGFNPRSHECVTRMLLARKLAALKGFGFGGEYPGAHASGTAVYFVPSRTLVGSDAAGLGIRSEDDLFGGVVPRTLRRHQDDYASACR